MAISYTMADDSIRSAKEIARLLQDAEKHLQALERIEKVVGRLNLDAESVRLQLQHYKREYDAAI